VLSAMMLQDYTLAGAALQAEKNKMVKKQSPERNAKVRHAGARTKEGLTALDLARKYNHTHLLASLEGPTAAK